WLPAQNLNVVMAGLVPAIHVLLAVRKTWMPATSAGMTVERPVLIQRTSASGRPVFTSQPTLLIGPSDWEAKCMPKEEFIRRIAGLWRMHPEAPCAIVYGDRCHNGELVYLTNLVPKLEAAVALLYPMDENELYVGGGPNMLDAARPLTWITG